MSSIRFHMLPSTQKRSFTSLLQFLIFLDEITNHHFTRSFHWWNRFNAQCLGSSPLLHDVPWARAQRFHQRPRNLCLRRQGKRKLNVDWKEMVIWRFWMVFIMTFNANRIGLKGSVPTNIRQLAPNYNEVAPWASNRSSTLSCQQRDEQISEKSGRGCSVQPAVFFFNPGFFPPTPGLVHRASLQSPWVPPACQPATHLEGHPKPRTSRENAWNDTEASNDCGRNTHNGPCGAMILFSSKLVISATYFDLGSLGMQKLHTLGYNLEYFSHLALDCHQLPQQAVYSDSCKQG